ncbi:hypothetical protein PR048_021329 [Dryococelus australis]|uniref:Transposase n=1 Tax=Dryococelus australis TaxID=614101 RepID=A0ABQ9GXY9_9NEOP|nr:hypothetical protein PR048_021329 [Dryococelus australis]
MEHSTKNSAVNAFQKCLAPEIKKATPLIKKFVFLMELIHNIRIEKINNSHLEAECNFFRHFTWKRSLQWYWWHCQMTLFKGLSPKSSFKPHSGL